MVVLGVLTGPSVVTCFNSPDGMGQCLRGKMVDAGLFPPPPATEIAETEAPAAPAAETPAVAPAQGEVTEAPALDVAEPTQTAMAPADVVAATFGLLRAEPDGSVVIAGSGTPGSEVEVYLNGSLLGRATVETSGDWVLVPDAPLPTGGVEITLGEKGKTGQSPDSFVVVIHDDKTTQPLVDASAPGQASEILQGLIRTPEQPIETAMAPLATPAAPAATPPVATPPASEPAAPASEPAAAPTTETPAPPAAGTPVQTAIAAPPAAPPEAAAATPTPAVAAPESTAPAAPAEQAAPTPEPATPAATETAAATPQLEPEPESAPAATTTEVAPQTAAVAPQPEVAPPVAPPALADTVTTIDAIEIEGARTFFAGGGPNGGIIRLYVDDVHIADAVVDNGRWLVEAGSVLSKPSQRIRADLLQPGSATVLSRAEVDFVVQLPETEQPSIAVADAPVAPAAPAPQPAATAPAAAPAEAPASGEATAAPAQSASAVPTQPALSAPAAPASSQQEPAVPPPEVPATAPSVQQAPAAAPAAATPAAQPALAAPQPETAPAAPPAEPASAPPAPSSPATASEPAPATAAPVPAAQPQPAVPTLVAVSVGDPDAQRFAAGKAIIRRGDNLWTIARRVYGEGIKYTTIYEANTGQIRDPHRIYPGQVFDLPTGQ